MLNDGGRLGGLNGLAPTIQNFGIGLTVAFPVMDRFAIREQEAMHAANIRAGQAQYQVIAAGLQAQFNAAQAKLTGARRVAANTPVEVSSARTALEQATARYQSGLAPIDDVAQAQRLLVQAQIDDALARLNVWRALLEIATARGDIQPFLAEAESSETCVCLRLCGGPSQWWWRWSPWRSSPCWRCSACRSTSSPRWAIPRSTWRSPTAAWTRRRWKATSRTTTSITSSTSPASITWRARAFRARRS